MDFKAGLLVLRDERGSGLVEVRVVLGEGQGPATMQLEESRNGVNWAAWGTPHEVGPGHVAVWRVDGSEGEYRLSIGRSVPPA